MPLNNSWLEGFAYRIEIHWWIFPMIGLLTVLIACDFPSAFKVSSS